MEQGVDPRNVFTIEDHNATHPKAIAWGGWTDVWVFRVLVPPHRAQCSRQEDRALQHFAQTKEGSPSNKGINGCRPRHTTTRMEREIE
jgi:hypothetical protein